MDIPPRFIIHESTHWLLNHRIDCGLPGYLILSAKQMTHSLATLAAPALTELGLWQACIQQAIETHLQPRRLYISRFGHDAGHSIHFHFIPIYPWVETLFWQDERYRSLQAFGSLETSEPQTDGAELTLYVWREFCERPEPPARQGPSIDQAIDVLRTALTRSVPGRASAP
ncbi:HIT family protein [Pseudomonas sp. RIT623]|uniref:HIT family protein n=1 Tax=Pseudomonas sp. RIT623 TaxID=2559075 RepID=UPI00106FC597|nr:HIT family protein [Pseudomonas sp. RIT623]TFF39927.1 HIT family protein [Pseudomonas sp. RIT623]